MAEVMSENIVALCDVNANNLRAAAKNAPGAKTFRDFRPSEWWEADAQQQAHIHVMWLGDNPFFEDARRFEQHRQEHAVGEFVERELSRIGAMSF